MQKASLSPALKSWGLPPPPFIAPTLKRSKSSTHQPHSHPNSRASSSSKRPSHTKSNSSSKTKENANAKGKTKASPGSGSGSANLAVPPSATTDPPSQPQTVRYARSSDFPLSNSQVWCGPQPRAKVGRPPKNASTNTANNTNLNTRTSSNTNRQLFTREPLDRARINRADSNAQREVGSGNRNESTEGEMDETTRMTLLSVLAALAAAGGDGGDQATNGALLNALTAIDSGSGSGSAIVDGAVPGGGTPTPALVNALKELLAAACGPSSTVNPALITIPSANSSTIATNTRFRSNSDISGAGEGEGEDEIVVLDKENVNPGAFRRKGEKGDGNFNSKSGGTREKEKERVRLGERSANAPGNMRKRTLSDFMEEKDAERERERLRDAATGKKRAGVSSSSIQRPHMHTQSDMDCPFSSASTSSTSHVFSNSILTANLAFRAAHTSPARPTFGRAISFGPAACSPAPAPGVLPVEGGAALPKKYVVPAWARTDTTTRPRLSEEVLAQRAAAEKEKEAEREKERRKKRGRGSGRKEGDGKMEMEEKSGYGMKKKGPQLVSTNSSADSMNITSLPVCASSDVTVVSPSSPFPASSPSDSSGATLTPFSQDAPVAVPKT